jgi:transposase
MPVENQAKSTGKSPQLAVHLTDPAARRTFVEALELGKSKVEILAELGIAQATYYKWKLLWTSRGVPWRDGVQVTNAKRMPGLSVEQTHEQIGELSLLKPKMGVKALAQYLAAEKGIHCAPTTIHSILQSRGISTRQDRAARLHQRYLANEPLSHEQRELVGTLDPFAKWPPGQERQPGRVLLQSVFRVHHTAPLNRTSLHIVVDANDQRSFAMFPTADDKTPEVTCLKLALESYKALGCNVEIVTTDNAHNFSGTGRGNRYDDYVKRQGIQHRYVLLTDNRKNPVISDVWKSLREYLYNDLKIMCIENRDKPCLLNTEIHKFLDAKFGGSLAV